jgi:hypothetical protein
MACATISTTRALSHAERQRFLNGSVHERRCLCNPYTAPRRASSFSYRQTAILRRPATSEWIMLDIVFVALGVGWLALCVGYAALCDRL